MRVEINCATALMCGCLILSLSNHIDVRLACALGKKLIEVTIVADKDDPLDHLGNYVVSFWKENESEPLSAPPGARNLARAFPFRPQIIRDSDISSLCRPC